jgi:hypothetical protein
MADGPPWFAPERRAASERSQESYDKDKSDKKNMIDSEEGE